MRSTLLLPLLLLGTLVVAPVPARADAPAAPSRAVAAPTVDPAMAALMRYAAELELGLVAPPADAVSSAPDTTAYRLVEVPSSSADAFMPIAGPRTGLPASLQGLFWMDGNPLPDKLVSFGASSWDAATRTTRIKVYDEGIWSWHGDLAGRALYGFVRAVELTYELQFNEALDFAEITPILHVSGKTVRVPSSIVRFTARLTGEGVLLRESYLFGRLFNTYHFRRVVTADGQRLPAFDDYVAVAPPTSVIAERIR